MISRSIQPGDVYRHFKNHDYEVLHVGVHTETDERFVVYKRVTGPNIVWIRPLSMFQEKVVHEGIMQHRFELVKPKA